MKVVIDIPENMDLRNYDIPYDILDIIINGTPLPKGHGRLIDASEYFKKEFGDARAFLDKASTIVEADTESEEDN